MKKLQRFKKNCQKALYNKFWNLYLGKDSLSLKGLIIFEEKSQSLPSKIMSLDCIKFWILIFNKTTQNGILPNNISKMKMYCGIPGVALGVSFADLWCRLQLCDISCPYPDITIQYGQYWKYIEFSILIKFLLKFDTRNRSNFSIILESTWNP